MFNISLVLISILKSTINDILSKFLSLTKVWSLLINNIFKDNSVISTIPNYFNNSKTPIICFKYNKQIRSTIFNSNKIATDTNIDSNTPDSLDCQNSNYLYPPARHGIAGSLNVIPDASVCNIISKGPKYRFPSYIDFPKCRREISASLNDFSNRWCKRDNVEPDALKERKINILKNSDTRISFYSCNTHILPINLTFIFVTFNEVSGLFMWTVFWFQQIKPLTML